jgi:hypothetical protein
MVKTLQDVSADSKLKQGVEKLHELAGVDLDLSEWKITGENEIYNGNNDTSKKIFEELDSNIYAEDKYGDKELYYDAKKNITTFDVANGESRLTDYKAIVGENSMVVKIDD